MQKQFLLVAEQITFRNNKLTAVNVWDSFTAIALPTKFNFDFAFICGPQWEPGEYDLNFKIKGQSEDVIDLGTIKANIATDKSVFNAIAQNLNFAIERSTSSLTFLVERNGELIFEREYPVNSMLEVKKAEPQPEQQENHENHEHSY
ncbi:MAG: hypothetical protein WCK67_06165 [bacterium]